jgi:excisionase family DNA binding protein
MSKRSIDLGEPGPLVVKPRVAWKMLSCSNTRGYELLAAGELQSYRDGRSRKITVESIQRYITRRLSPTAK